MSYLPQIATDIASRVLGGHQCYNCADEFMEPQNRPAICHDCFDKMLPKERDGVKEALCDTKDVHLGKISSRAKRTRSLR